MLVVISWNSAGDRPKNFFLGDAHFRLGIDEQSRAHEVAVGVSLQGAPAKSQHGTLCLANFDISQVLLVLRLFCDGADLSIGVEGMSDLQGLQPCLHTLGKAPIDALLDDEARRSSAALASREIGSLDCRFDCLLQNCVIQHHQGILPTHLQLQFGQARAGGHEDPAASFR
ncbi:hypothetical protein D9M70_522190 [compost metagenome]